MKEESQTVSLAALRESVMLALKMKKSNITPILMVFGAILLVSLVTAHACENGGIWWRIDTNGDSILCNQAKTWPLDIQYNRLIWWKNVGCSRVDDYTVHPERYTVLPCDGDDSCCACAQYHANFDNPGVHNEAYLTCEPVGSDDDGDGIWTNWHPDYIRAKGPFQSWYNPPGGDDCDDTDPSIGDVCPGDCEAQLEIEVTHASNYDSPNPNPSFTPDMSDSVFVGDGGPVGTGFVNIFLTTNEGADAITDTDTNGDVPGLHVERGENHIGKYVEISAYGKNDAASREAITANINFINAEIDSAVNKGGDPYEGQGNSICGVDLADPSLSNPAQDEFSFDIGGTTGEICSITNAGTDAVRIYYTPTEECPTEECPEGTTPIYGSNLLENPGFETVPNSNVGQGFMPSDWVTLPASIGVPGDTYSNDGSYGLQPGVAPFANNFLGVLAYEGIRFVAGWAIVPELIVQDLSSPLESGETYRISGWLQQSYNHDTQGAYEIYLAEDHDVNVLTTGKTKVGQLDHTDSYGDGWTYRETSFVASGSGKDVFALSPYNVGSNAYPGLDDVSLNKFEGCEEEHIECDYDSDCDLDICIADNNFCSGDELWNEYRYYTCEDAGTTDSYCMENVDNRIIAYCDFACDPGLDLCVVA
jgi:hypothetical protein